MGRRKRKSAIKGPLCIICQASYSPSSSIIPRSSSCNSLPQHAICDSCLHKHILTVISKDITNQIICPAQGCNTELPRITIQTALSAFGYQNLWEEYVFKSNWRGTSNQWIKRFTVKCPGCRVPIEKNGGCDHMVCRQCHLHFNWNQAKNFNMYRFRIWWRTNQFGGSLMGGGFPPQFSGAFPQQGYGQFGGGGGFFGGGAPFQGGNGFPGGSQFPPAPPPTGGQFGQGFGFPPGSGGFGYQQPPYAPPFSPGQQPQFGAPFSQGQQPQFGSSFSPGQQPQFGAPFSQGQQPQFGPSFPPGQQPQFGPSFPSGQQPPYGNANYFGSGNYGRPRSRHSSRRRSRTRRRRSTSPSSSSDDYQQRASPIRGRENPYPNVSPYPNMTPLIPQGGSPVIPPRRPVW